MSDEAEFHQALRLARNFDLIELRMRIKHPTLPTYEIEVDNLAQKSNTTFVFEGKFKDDQSAIEQLKTRYKSLKTYRQYYQQLFGTHTTIRLFYYSFKKKIIAEFSENGNKFSSQHFNDLNELSTMLRKL